MYNTGLSADRYDVEFLESLNAEYESKPIVPRPRSTSASDMFEAARRRVRWAHNHVDLRGKRVLEIGCGNGAEVWTMAHNLGCDAYGIDVLELGSWAALTGDRCHFTCADMAVESPYPENHFDRVVSYTVWEHLLHPYKMLEEMYRILKPGGLAWIRANLYAGPKASHRYRDIFFPWPHLLFTDEVVRDWDIKHGRTPKGLSWVNRLSMHHYRNYFAHVGFRLRRLSIQEANFDEAFYCRFENVLGQFPMTDLKQDFFLAVLEKPS
jgi:SAM-dependent methyltransferase